MRRWLVTIVILGLIGAVINVVVAWACALWSPFEQPYGTRLDAMPRDLGAMIPSDWLEAAEGHSVGVVARAYRLDGFGVLVTLAETKELIPGDHSLGPDRVVHVHRVGWPLLSMECDGFLDQTGTTGLRQVWHGGIAVPEVLRARYHGLHFFPSYRAALPLRPRVGGFAADTALFAVFAGLLAAGPRLFRRHIRSRQGLCRACDYPIGVSEVCTECGRPVRTGVSEAAR